MQNLPFLLDFTIRRTDGPAERYKIPTAFDNMNIELFAGDQLMSPSININGSIHFFSQFDSYSESKIKMNARHNPAIDGRYKFNNLDSILTGSATVAGHMAYDGNVRLTYYHSLVESINTLHTTNKVSDATFSMLRYQAQKASKLQLSVIGQNLSEFPPFGKPIASQKKLAEDIGNGLKRLSPNAKKTRTRTTNFAKVSRGIGTGIVVFSAAQSIHHIYGSPDKMRTAAHEVGGWTGSIAGGETGMLFGSEIGGAVGLCFGGIGFAPGAAIGGFIGGIAGGIGGYIWGYKAATKILPPHHMAQFEGFGGGSGGGGGASGSW